MDTKDEQIDLQEPAQTNGEDELDQEDQLDDGQDEDQTDEPQDQEEPAEQADTPDEPQPSRRETLRVQQLLQKMRQGRQDDAIQAKAPQNAMDYSQRIEADPALINELETDRNQFGKQMFDQGLEQAKAIQFTTRLEIDAPRVEAKYPVLDKTAEEFNPVLADAVNNWYLTTVGFDADTRTVKSPDIRYSDFVESVFELADEIASKKQQNTVKNIAQQAAQTGIRPDGSQASKTLDLSKDPEDMTDEELEAFIGKNLRGRRS